ncbi:hypothetical protein SCA6_001672 [Theobroma cacao]
MKNKKVFIWKLQLFIPHEILKENEAAGCELRLPIASFSTRGAFGTYQDLGCFQPDIYIRPSL